MPIMIPTDDQKLSHKAKFNSKVPYVKYTIVEAAEEYIIMYMLVELETIGGTPSDIITGLKIEPPPRPRAPLVHPPRTENKIIITIYFAL